MQFGYDFLIATLMGFIFLSASPDAWKRVHLVVKNRRSSRRFLAFIVAGVAPFVVLLPLASRTPGIPDGQTNVGVVFASLITNNVLFVATALGLIASFLSAFNGGLLSSVQVGLIVRRVELKIKDETPRFHWLMVTALFVTCFAFLALLSAVANPYFLASALLGPYAIVGGIQIATRGLVSKLPEGILLWVVAIGAVAWFGVIVSGPSLVYMPTTYQLNAVPSGILLALATAIVCSVAMAVGKRDA